MPRAVSVGSTKAAYRAVSIHSTDAIGKAEIEMFSLPSEYCTARLL